MKQTLDFDILYSDALNQSKRKTFHKYSIHFKPGKFRLLPNGRCAGNSMLKFRSPTDVPFVLNGSYRRKS